MDAPKAVKQRGESNGVQAAVTVLEVLSAFIGAGPSPMLKTLAERTGMHPAKVHRYLSSLCQAGFVEQDPDSSRYSLGVASLRLGVAAMSSIDAIRVARPLMLDFCHRLKHTVVLAVWAGTGPTIAIKESMPGLFVMSASEGYTVPLLRSSIGRVFSTYSSREKTQSMIELELQEALPGTPPTMEEVEALFEEVRRRGLARTTGQLSQFVHSLAAPVFGVSGEIVAVLCTLGSAGEFNSNWTSPAAHTLRECAAELSERLGYV
jgi:DNA-binding IclR family transcriptional regulator